MKYCQNLQPYYDDDLLSSVVSAAKKVREWLRLDLPKALDNTTPLAELNNVMLDRVSWDRVAELCHMSASQFENQLKARLEQRVHSLFVKT